MATATEALVNSLLLQDLQSQHYIPQIKEEWKINKQNVKKQQLTKSHIYTGVNLSISLLLFDWFSLPTEENATN